MALPTLIKTWQFNVNQAISGATTEAIVDALWLAIVASLKGFASGAWTVWGSCDGAGGAGSFGNADAVDRWVDASDLVHDSAGSNHSWTVLRNSVTGLSVCFDLNSGGAAAASAVVSWSAGFGLVNGGADGTATARPTASDEYLLMTGAMFDGGAAQPYRLHAMHSSDGQCTRVAIYRANVGLVFGLFDEVSSPVGLTNPVAIWKTDGSSEQLNWNQLTGGTAAVWSRIGASAAFSMFMTCEAYSIVLLPNALTFPDDDTGEWPMMPIALISLTGTHRGRKGGMFDLWWGSNVAGSGSTYPDDASKQFAQLSNMIFPWNGTTPLTA